MLLAFSGERPEMLLNIPHCTAPHYQELFRWRDADLERLLLGPGVKFPVLLFTEGRRTVKKIQCLFSNKMFAFIWHFISWGCS